MPIDLERLKRLETEWRNLQPLPAPLEERFWLKLRLEWNYHSNHIEGNTLTYGETKAFLLHDEVSGNHTGREYAEMKGHDLAIELISNLAVTPQEITEADVRNLNQIILKESFYKEAITLEGQPTRKLITPGRYKEEPNSVRTSTGELFEYASPTDVPVRMGKLLEAVRNCKRKEGLELLAALAITHHEFTLIHPFDDGNGRVARLVTNYALLKNRLPPLVIPSEKKSEYLTALRQADGGDTSLLTNFFADQLVWSLELGIKAGKGADLEEPGDIEKEIELFVREQKSRKKRPLLKKDAEIVYQFLNTSVQVLFEKFDEKTKRFEDIFESRALNLSHNVPHRISKSWRENLKSIDTVHLDQLSQINLMLSLKGFLGTALHPFRLDQVLTVHLQEYEYSVEAYGRQLHHAVYADALTDEIADVIVSAFLKQLLQQIKLQTGQ